jgi:hypothetical protein
VVARLQGDRGARIASCNSVSSLAVCEWDEQAEAPVSPSATDRRLYRRIARAELLAPAGFRIQHRPAVSLIDLSAGGALLELPFQLMPDSRVIVELLTPKEKIVTPFRLLRCHVQNLQQGIRYHAAGAFEQILNLPVALTGTLPHTTTERIVATLEAFLRHSRVRGGSQHVNGFDELLMWIMDATRRGEPVTVMSSQFRARLAWLFPSLAINRANGPYLNEPAKSARFFGLDFRSNRVLSGSDRRLLRAAAQLLALLEAESQPAALAVAETPAEAYSSVLTYSSADWQVLRRKVAPLPVAGRTR